MAWKPTKDKTPRNDIVRKHKLLPEEIRGQLPSLYSQDGKGEDAIVYAKFFTPDSNWIWYVLEFDGEDLCFGLVIGHEKKYGYFSLRELESVNGPWGLPIERDLDFKPTEIRNLAPA